MGQGNLEGEESWRGGRPLHHIQPGWKDLLPRRGSPTSTSSISRRGVPGSSLGCQHTGVKGKSPGRIRRRRDLCHSVRHTATSSSQQGSSAKAGSRKQQRFWFGGFRAGCDARAAEKELARRGYQIRKGACSVQRQGSLPSSQRGQITKGKWVKGVFSAGGVVEELEEGRRSSSGHSGHADVGEVREAASQQTFPKFKQFEKFQWIRKQPQLKPATPQNKRSCSSHRGISGISEKDATEASPLHQAVHQGGGRGAWCGRREGLHPTRFWKEDFVGEAAFTAENALSPFGDTDLVASEKIRERGVANNAWSSCPTPNSTGPRGLELELDADSPSQCLGSEAMGRICRGAGKCGILFEVNGRPQQECREGPQCSVPRLPESTRTAKSCKARQGQSKRKGQRWQGQGRGEDRELTNQLMVKPSDTKLSETNSVLEALRTGHGSFSRFLKVLQDEPFFQRFRAYDISWSQ